MEVRSVRVDVDICNIWEGCEANSLSASGLVDRTELLCLLKRLHGPYTSTDIVSGLLVAKKVQWDTCVLQRSASLHEEYSVVFWDVYQLTQIGLGLFVDGHEMLTTVRHFHRPKT